MEGQNRRTSVIFGLLYLMLVVPSPAMAYVDPGSGALMWQIMLASVAGLTFKMRTILNWWSRRRPN
jgi:hypothetical protein